MWLKICDGFFLSLIKHDVAFASMSNVQKLGALLLEEMLDSDSSENQDCVEDGEFLQEKKLSLC